MLDRAATVLGRIVRSSAVAYLFACSVGSVAVAAQSPGPATTATLRGQVIDSIGGDPISGVLVRMETGEEAVSDRLGRFVVAGLAPGEHTLALLTADCRITWARIDIAAGVSREVEIRLSPAFGAAARQEREDEADRQRAKGRILVAEEIDRMNARSATDLVRRLAPTMVRRWTGVVGEPAAINGRAPSSIAAESVPVLVVDGVRVSDVAYMLDQLQPSEVDTIEVLQGAAGGWEFGSQGAAGVIRVVRRRGVADGALDEVAVNICTVPGFRGRGL